MRRKLDLNQCYEVLGLDHSASPSEVKSAFRRLALQHHPDQSKDPRSIETFKSISQAYHTILNSSDPYRMLADIIRTSLKFTIEGSKGTTIHMVSASEFVSQVRKYFGPRFGYGTQITIDNRTFEIDIKLENNQIVREKVLLEWIKTSDGDRWRPYNWEDFWDYVRIYAQVRS